MLKTRSMVLLLLILGAGIVSGILLNNSLTMKTVEAQQNFNAKGNIAVSQSITME